MLLLLPASSALFPTAAQPLGRRLLDAALNSPLYKAVLVPQAKRTMVSTAEQNGVPWSDALEWIQSQGPWSLPEVHRSRSRGTSPEHTPPPAEHDFSFLDRPAWKHLSGQAHGERKKRSLTAVSYTHLTLPTILLV